MWTNTSEQVDKYKIKKKFVQAECMHTSRDAATPEERLDHSKWV